MLLSDWLHEDAAERYPGRLAVNTGQDPESMLINGKGQFRDPNTGFMTNTPLEIFTMTPGRRYRFRMINAFSTVCPAQITIEGHQLTVIATDGEPVHPVNVNTIISFSGKSTWFITYTDNWYLIIARRSHETHWKPSLRRPIVFRIYLVSGPGTKPISYVSDVVYLRLIAACLCHLQWSAAKRKVKQEKKKKSKSFPNQLKNTCDFNFEIQSLTRTG